MAESRRTCNSCGTTNEEDARFCEGCGASLARTCATCGVEAKSTARFCRGCGAPLDGQAAARDVPSAGPVRKTVTVMFADLAGSTTFEERVDAETAREVIGRYHDLLRAAAERHRAGVTKYIGDGFMAVWGVPEVGPDDAVHAVDAAVELQERFIGFAAQIADTLGVELALRVSVNTGEVVVGAGDADLVGDALNVGARLEAECPRGRVVVGEETWRSTRGRYSYESLGEVQVKGRTAPVAVYQWLSRQAESTDAAPFVGRTDEVHRVQAAMDNAISARTARLVTVIGDPGVGKSRLSAEFARAQPDARVVEARCDLDATVALAPLVEVLRASDLENDVPADVPERDRLLRDLDGLASGIPGSVEENFWALRRWVEVLATASPVVLVLDDIHWADTLLLDFIEHLVEWVKEAPVLVLALARPELRDIRPELVTVSRWVSEAVHLGGLDAGATAELAATVLGATRLPDELLNRLPSSTGGNPLFVRELIGMLAHDGVLVEEPHGWRLTIDVDAIAIPPTIHALLASRLERLDATDRRVLEIASVVGSDFSLGIVRALAGKGAEGIKLSLRRLRRLELAQPSGAYVGDEPVWRFHHVLIRDVAYRRLLKSDRADLHERLADWVVAGGHSVAFDADEMIARHLEAAHTYRVELGTVDKHTGELALRSARHYATSARRALDRDELVSAGTQAARGAAVASADDTLHAELLLIGCEAYLSAGDVAAGAPLVDDLERIADDSLAPWATCYRCQFVVHTEPERLPEVDARLQGAIDEFGRRKDPAGLAKAHRVRASARSRLGRIGDCEADLFEALIAARQSGDHRQITAALGAAPGAALWGPSPVPKAGGRCLDVVRMQRMTTAAPSLEATSLRHLAVLELLRGRPDKARKMLADARQVVADLGLRHGLMETELFAGIIESMDGDPGAAEPHFRTALDGFRALGVGADAGQAAALLARMVLAQGRVDEADRYAAESERLAGRNLKTAIAWRSVRAEILAAQGRHEEAGALAHDAVVVAAGTDLVLDHADACLALRRVLDAAGDIESANAARSNAEALYVAKEVTARIGRVGVPNVPAPPVVTQLKPSRLAATNQASEVVDAAWRAFQGHNFDGALADFSDRIAYDDRRRFSGMPIKDIGELRVATQRARAQFQYSDWRTLAVRGERLELRSIRVWDDAGNEATTLNVFEIGDHGRVESWCRFDEDDFEGAYRELDRRYYAGDGAAFAASGNLSTECIAAVNQGDFDRLFGELSNPDVHAESHTRSAFPNRSAGDLHASFESLAAMVASSRTWLATVCWVSPLWTVSRFEREAVGHDGELYSWTRILVIGVRDDRLVTLCEIELDDEEAAFAYAEEQARETTSRLAVTNQADRMVQAFWAAMRSHDVDAALECCSEGIVYDDRRSITGDPIHGLSALGVALSRILEQYTDFTSHTMAVRGERLLLGWSRWSTDGGFQTTYLHVIETGEHGRVVHETRFDEDDFEGAYREFETRYLAGEGEPFAEEGLVALDWVVAMNRDDVDRAFGELVSPGAQTENRSRMAFPDRSVSDPVTSYMDLKSMVVSIRTWPSAACWLSNGWFVVRIEREAVGPNGETYAWSWLNVSAVHDGRFASSCVFDVEDEDAAFAYAEEQMRTITSRLPVTNASCKLLPAFTEAMRTHDVDASLASFSEHLVYDDHRRLSGDPIVGLDAMRAAIQRIFEQYSQFEFRVLAVRGELLSLVLSHWSDIDGNETVTLYVNETDLNGRSLYQGRFDEDDFDGAYRELERRYYAGEGAEFAEHGATSTNWALALNRADFDTMFDELTAADLRVENRSRSAFPDRSAQEYRTMLEELTAMVVSVRTWVSAIHWLSQHWCLARGERDAVGEQGEHYSWHFLLAFEFRDGRVASMCEFELDDEGAAFAYAEDQVRRNTTRLRISNRASELAKAASQALQAHDVDALRVDPSEHFVYDDRRRISGDPIEGAADLHAATERILHSYPHTEWRTIAVRGERLEMHSSRLWDDDGNEATTLNVMEFDDAGRLEYFGRFEEDDFEGASRELDRRYFAGEGAAFAENGVPSSEAPRAMDRNDFDYLFGELCSPDLLVESRSSRAFPHRSAGDLRRGFEDLNTMVASKQTWNSAVVWLSPTCSVIRLEREATGHEGEKYRWAMILAAEHADGRLISLCEFDPEDEEGAFAYAEERIRAATPRLAVTNRAGETLRALQTAMQAHGIDASIACYAEPFSYGDHRRIGGGPIDSREAMRAAILRVFDQYTQFEHRVLAVRGQRLVLFWSRWSDVNGNETVGLFVHESGNDGRIGHTDRFDEDDFEGAYRELERRYYADEGAQFAEAGNTSTEYAMIANQGNLDRVFDDLTAPGFHLENRTRSGFPDRSIAEFRASMDELGHMVASVRTWNSAICWLSPNWCVCRMEREAVGQGGENYSWTRVVACEIVDGRVTSMCAFEVEDEAAAFDFVEQRMRAASSRIAVTNSSVLSADRLGSAMNAHDIDAIMKCFSDQLVYDDRRRLTGDPISGRAEFRSAFERILSQYSHFERRVLAVRGERLNLHWGRWTDDSGNETSYLHVFEMDDDGLQIYEGRFDEDNFEDAYRELEKRYIAGEGAPFAKSVELSTEWISALNRGEFDRMLSEFSTPDVHAGIRSRSAFPERSALGLSASLHELDAMVTSIRTWNSAVTWLSPNCNVVRMHREALGPEGEKYEWTRLYVIEFRDGLLASLCEFELEDEDAAFAYAEEQLRASSSRLAVTNRSCTLVQKLANAMCAHDIDALVAVASDDYLYIDHRRLSGDPIWGRVEWESALKRLFEQYNHFDFSPLAVRGELLSLHKSSWSDDAGNMSSYLHVFEIDDDGRAVHEARFDENDFDDAYRELERRYYAGEGAIFGESGAIATEYSVALNQQDLDRFFGELSTPDMRLENRSRSVFPDRSIAEFRTSLEDLHAMVSSMRTWNSAQAWVSPAWGIVRQEREAVGLDGERFAWTRIYVAEIRNGRVAALIQFESDDEVGAFAYAEERARLRESG